MKKSLNFFLRSERLNLKKKVLCMRLDPIAPSFSNLSLFKKFARPITEAHYPRPVFPRVEPPRCGLYPFLAKCRFSWDQKIFTKVDKFLDCCVLDRCKNWFSMGVHSRFSQKNPCDEQESMRRELLQKGVDILKIAEEAREVFSLTEKPLISFERMEACAKTQGVFSKRITVNPEQIQDRNDAIFAIGHEIGHILNEDLFKSYCTGFFAYVVTVYEGFAFLDDKNEKSISSFLMKAAPALISLYIFFVQERQMEFRANKYGLLFLHKRGSLEDFLHRRQTGMTRWEMFKSLVSWPMYPNSKESIQYYNEQSRVIGAGPGGVP